MANRARAGQGAAGRPPSTARPEPRLAEARPSAIAFGSPAAGLQQHLAEVFDARPDDRWSPRRTLAFIITVCGGFWMAVAFGLNAAFN